jgi:hypothetical protein
VLATYYTTFPTYTALSRAVSRFSTSFSDILTLSPFSSRGWPQPQLSRRIRPSHVCRFVHKAFVQGAHRVSDFSGSPTGRDEEFGLNEKVKEAVVGVVSTVC